MYHEIEQDSSDYRKSPVENRPYILRESQFREQMEHLSTHGYKVFPLGEFINRRSMERELPPETVIISFDDGHISNYTKAYPILKKYNFPAIFFVVAGRVGLSDTLSWNNMKEMIENGMEVGSHTLTHPCPSKLTDEELRYELSESKKILEENLGKDILFLSSPTGYYNPSIKTIARHIGYQAVCLGQTRANDLYSDAFALRRISIKRDYDLSMFKSIVELQPTVILTKRIKELSREVLRTVLGCNNYEIIKSSILKRKGLL